MCVCVVSLEKKMRMAMGELTCSSSTWKCHCWTHRMWLVFDLCSSSTTSCWSVVLGLVLVDFSFVLFVFLPVVPFKICFYLKSKSTSAGNFLTLSSCDIFSHTCHICLQTLASATYFQKLDFIYRSVAVFPFFIGDCIIISLWGRKKLSLSTYH